MKLTKFAVLPRFTVCTVGCMLAVSGDVTAICTSKVSLPSELVAVQKKAPLSDRSTAVIISVPSLIFARPVANKCCMDSSLFGRLVCQLEVICNG